MVREFLFKFVYALTEMKKLFIIFLFFSLTTTVKAQTLYIDSTRFVGGDSSCGGTSCRYALKTKDVGIFFAGITFCASGGGNIPVNFTGMENIVVGKLDSNLNVIWVRVYGGSYSEGAKYAVQTTDGGYAVLSITNSNDHDVSGNHAPANTTGDLWVIRFDSLGNLLWQKCYGSAYDEQPISIASTHDNGFIIFGNSNGQGGDVPNHYTGSTWDYDWVVIKTDSVGTVQWSKTIGGTGWESSKGGSILTVNNGYYLIGSSWSRDFDCTDTFWHPEVGCGMDYFMFRLDSVGNILWDSSYGGSGNEWISQAILDPRDSSILINGTTWSNNYMVTGYHGDGDYWVIKTDKNGKLLWEKCLGDSLLQDAYGICTTPTGYMVYGNTNPGPIGHSDALIYQLDSIGNIITKKLFGGSSYETPASIFTFKTGFIATGECSSPSITEGINVGMLANDNYDAYFSFLSNTPSLIKDIKEENNNELIIYPNPATSLINIANYTQGNFEVSIIDLSGKRVYLNYFHKKESKIEIEVRDWAKGTYFVKMKSETGNTTTQKIFIQ